MKNEGGGGAGRGVLRDRAFTVLTRVYCNGSGSIKIRGNSEQTGSSLGSAQILGVSGMSDS